MTLTSQNILPTPKRNHSLSDVETTVSNPLFNQINLVHTRRRSVAEEKEQPEDKPEFMQIKQLAGKLEAHNGIQLTSTGHI